MDSGLAVLETALSAMVNSGRDSASSLTEVSTLMAKVLAVTALQDLAIGPGVDALPTLRTRVAYVSNLLSSQNLDQPDFARLDGKLDQINESALVAATDHEALRRLVDQLQGLLAWAEKRGVEWPPRLGVSS